MLSAFRRPSASRRSRAQSGTQSGATARRPRIGVERLERKLLLAVVTNLNDAGAGSLRAAIEAVNSPGATDYSIVFQNLVGTIYTKSALPTLAVTGTTFTTTGTSAITLDGTAAGTDANGLTIGNGVNTIGINGLQLTIQNFQQNGILFAGGSTGSTLRGLTLRVNGQNGIQLAGGTYTGTAIMGSAISDNAKAGIAVLAGAPGLALGGTVAGDGNNIYGNTTNGIELAAGSYTGATIAANRIVDNVKNGIATSGGVTGLTIGGTGSATANSITINSGNGIQLGAGDYTGTTIVGNSVILNDIAGISLAPAAGTLSSLMIGGTAAGTSNSIALNTAGGVVVGAGAYTGTAIVGNQIIANKTAGVSLDPSAGVLSGLAIGGAAASQSNSITSTTGVGVLVAPGTYTSTTVAGNIISASSGHGVSLAGASGKIMGLVIGVTPNTISSNGGDGINVATGTYSGTTIQDNTITSNTGVGIRLAPGGGSLIDLLVGGSTATALGNRLSANSTAVLASDAELVVEQGTYTGTKVQGNEITEAATGIHLSGAQGITIGGDTADLGNTVTGSSDRGLSVMGNVAGSKAVNNTFTNNTAGVRLDSATGFALGDGTTGNTITGGTTGITATGGLGGTTVRANRVTGQRVGIRVLDAQGTSAAEPFTIGTNTKTAGTAGGNSVVATTIGLHALGNLANTVIVGNVFRATAVNGNGAALTAATNLLMGGVTAGDGNLLTSSQGSAFYAKGVSTGTRVFRNNMTASRFGILLDNAKALSVGTFPVAASSNIVQYNQTGVGTAGNCAGSGVMHTRWFKNIRNVVNPSGIPVYPTP